MHTTDKYIASVLNNLIASFDTAYQSAMQFCTLDDDGNLTEDEINSFIQKYNDLGKQFETTGEVANSKSITQLTIFSYSSLIGRFTNSL